MPTTDAHVTLALSPRGRLALLDVAEATPIASALAGRLRGAFDRGSGHGLLQLGGAELGTPLPPALHYWRAFGTRYVVALCTRPGNESLLVPHTPVAPPDIADLERFALAAPAMPGAEYLEAELLQELWREMDSAFAARRLESGATAEELVKRLNSAWNVVGRVHLNLAENRRDDSAPFAFLATYTHGLTPQGAAQHRPLGAALRDYAAATDRPKLLSLLIPVQRAAERCTWLRAMVDTGEIFHPLRWTAADAFRMLSSVPDLEQAGVIVRMPAQWHGSRPTRPVVSVSLGARPPAGLGIDAMLDFHMALTLDGDTLSPAEIEGLLSATRGLVLMRGQWVEVDAGELQSTLERLEETQRLAEHEGISFAEAVRMLSGATINDEQGPAVVDRAWSHVTAGPWLATLLQQMRSPMADGRSPVVVVASRQLQGTLRPYQEAGVQWLDLLSTLGLGACLADDMGLGKTVQVIALLLARGHANTRDQRPSLLVAPASLIANWQAELARFAPTLRARVAHRSAAGERELAEVDEAQLANTDLVITTYGALLRYPWLTDLTWDLAILDEAQAIRNPATKGTRAAKRLKARSRIALTGTPVENRLTDLWSIFDYLNPGLLGSLKQFQRHTKGTSEGAQQSQTALRELVRPYILRRLKTDRRVIADLPDKTEIKAWCHLSKKQAALYQDSVNELQERLGTAAGMARRGLVLAFFMRFKQICNHPSQWLKDGRWDPRDSGKLARLREIADTIAARQEKALVFTQFREMTEPLAAFLTETFGRAGVVLHGGVEVKRRQQLVRRFQEDDAVPFFVISLKAGGSGLNLTAASHVIHFDRWWNPAVENQATDRAFRIGQAKNVLVHKFICRGTVEEKIDGLIESKEGLSRAILDDGPALNLSELSDDEIIRLVSLDLNAAMEA